VQAHIARHPPIAMVRQIDSPVRRTLAIMLLVLGFLFVILTFLAAFTIYGEAAAVAGFACIVGGAILLGRSGAQSG
jgi:hypothetical protein